MEQSALSSASSSASSSSSSPSVDPRPRKSARVTVEPPSPSPISPIAKLDVSAIAPKTSTPAKLRRWPPLGAFAALPTEVTRHVLSYTTNFDLACCYVGARQLKAAVAGYLTHAAAVCLLPPPSVLATTLAKSNEGQRTVDARFPQLFALAHALPFLHVSVHTHLRVHANWSAMSIAHAALTRTVAAASIRRTVWARERSRLACYVGQVHERLCAFRGDWIDAVDEHLLGVLGACCTRLTDLVLSADNPNVTPDRTDCLALVQCVRRRRRQLCTLSVVGAHLGAFDRDFSVRLVAALEDGACMRDLELDCAYESIVRPIPPPPPPPELSGPSSTDAVSWRGTPESKGDGDPGEQWNMWLARIAPSLPYRDACFARLVSLRLKLESRTMRAYQPDRSLAGSLTTLLERMPLLELLRLHVARDRRSSTTDAYVMHLAVTNYSPPSVECPRLRTLEMSGDSDVPIAIVAPLLESLAVSAAAPDTLARLLRGTFTRANPSGPLASGLREIRAPFDPLVFAASRRQLCEVLATPDAFSHVTAVECYGELTAPRLRTLVAAFPNMRHFECCADIELGAYKMARIIGSGGPYAPGDSDWPDGDPDKEANDDAKEGSETTERNKDAAAAAITASISTVVAVVVATAATASAIADDNGTGKQPRKKTQWSQLVALHVRSTLADRVHKPQTRYDDSVAPADGSILLDRLETLEWCGPWLSHHERVDWLVAPRLRDLRVSDTHFIAPDEARQRIDYPQRFPRLARLALVNDALQGDAVDGVSGRDDTTTATDMADDAVIVATADLNGKVETKGLATVSERSSPTGEAALRDAATGVVDLEIRNTGLERYGPEWVTELLERYIGGGDLETLVVTYPFGSVDEWLGVLDCLVRCASRLGRLASLRVASDSHAARQTVAVVAPEIVAKIELAVSRLSDRLPRLSRLELPVAIDGAAQLPGRVPPPRATLRFV